ncbi:hypothetical protein [Peptoanaerobacter stomatis]|uniref:hypothetical protein n=1 Tax=Peptoanaerobacter stomatis TaxID=796937 RepID=UPI003FA093AA
MNTKIYFSSNEQDYITAKVEDIETFIEYVQHCRNTGEFIKVQGIYNYFYINPDKIRYVI